MVVFNPALRVMIWGRTTDPFLDKMLDLIFWIFSLFSFYMWHKILLRTASSSIIASAANATTMKRWCFVKRNARFACLCEYIYIHMNFIIIIIIRKRRLSFAGALGLFSLKNIHGKWRRSSSPKLVFVFSLFALILLLLSFVVRRFYNHPEVIVATLVLLSIDIFSLRWF